MQTFIFLQRNNIYIRVDIIEKIERYCGYNIISPTAIDHCGCTNDVDYKFGCLTNNSKNTFWTSHCDNDSNCKVYHYGKDTDTMCGANITHNLYNNNCRHKAQKETVD